MAGDPSAEQPRSKMAYAVAGTLATLAVAAGFWRGCASDESRPVRPDPSAPEEPIIKPPAQISDEPTDRSADTRDRAEVPAPMNQPELPQPPVLLQDTILEYYPNGRLKIRSAVLRIEANDGSVTTSRNGHTRTYFDSYRAFPLRTDSWWTDGKLDGKWTLYRVDGTTLIEVTFSDGMLNGPFKIYYATQNGNFIWVDGQLSGTAASHSWFTQEQSLFPNRDTINRLVNVAIDPNTLSGKVGPWVWYFPGTAQVQQKIMYDPNNPDR